VKQANNASQADLETKQPTSNVPVVKQVNNTSQADLETKQPTSNAPVEICNNNNNALFTYKQ
jgi:hypothetical protein